MKPTGPFWASVSIGRFLVIEKAAAGSGARPFGGQALGTVAATPGVTGAQPVETSSVRYNGQAYAAWGLGPHPLYSCRLSAGRWFTAADTAAATPPVVPGPVVADASGPRVGQVLTLDMAAGPVRARVIGIGTGHNNSGNIVYFPLPTLERLDGTPGVANSLWVSTASTAHAAIDQAATAVASRLPAAGYPVTTSKIYALEAQITASENSILAIVEILGLVVVAIMLMGLASGPQVIAAPSTRTAPPCRAARIRPLWTNLLVTPADSPADAPSFEGVPDRLPARPGGRLIKSPAHGQIARGSGRRHDWHVVRVSAGWVRAMAPACW